MSNLIPFQFQKNQIRVITDESGEPLFYAQDLAVALDYSGTAAMNKIIDDDDKMIQTFLDGTTYKKQTLINESGVYQKQNPKMDRIDIKGFFCTRSNRP